MTSMMAHQMQSGMYEKRVTASFDKEIEMIEDITDEFKGMGLEPKHNNPKAVPESSPSLISSTGTLDIELESTLATPPGSTFMPPAEVDIDTTYIPFETRYIGVNEEGLGIFVDDPLDTVKLPQDVTEVERPFGCKSCIWVPGPGIIYDDPVSYTSPNLPTAYLYPETKGDTTPTPSTTALAGGDPTSLPPLPIDAPCPPMPKRQYTKVFEDTRTYLLELVEEDEDEWEFTDAEDDEEEEYEWDEDEEAVNDRFARR